MEDDPFDNPTALAPAHLTPHWIDEDKTPLPTLYDEDGYPVIDFAPVPIQRRL